MYYEFLCQGLRVWRDYASINLCIYARTWVYVIIFAVLTMLSIAQIKNLWLVNLYRTTLSQIIED
jgi:hypothetical protein